jgi:putative membrane protein
MPPAMLPMHWDMLRDLEDASSSRIDDDYIEQQVEAHEVAVELHRNFAANGQSPRAKAYAESMLPTATRHLERARQLDR